MGDVAEGMMRSCLRSLSCGQLEKLEIESINTGVTHCRCRGTPRGSTVSRPIMRAPDCKSCKKLETSLADSIYAVTTRLSGQAHGIRL